jgi:septum formation protein
MKRVILASASPRRKELLSLLVKKFEVVPSEVEENSDLYDSPQEIVEQLALLKAREIAKRVNKESLVIAADTIVFQRGSVLEKPKDHSHAKRMLVSLQGASHEVWGGIALVKGSGLEEKVCCSKTKVTFAPMSEQDILKYVATGDPMDKAGAYGIQGAMSAYVDKIEGSYTNVVGLDLALLRRMLNDFDESKD